MPRFVYRQNWTCCTALENCIDCRVSINCFTTE